MTESNETSGKALQIAYDAIKEESNRLFGIVDQGDALQVYSERIRAEFVDFDAEAARLLETISKELESGDLQKGWQSYIKLKKKLSAHSSEVLAILGGVYLMQTGLDHASQEETPLSFSVLADNFAKELAERSKSGAKPVLIVAEERLDPSVASVIRLRFPACDIWHLPFTAHEFGYLVAHNNPPNHFKYLLKQENDKTLTQNHEDQHLELKKQQKTHLCRLFADAFATFFIGPAYVHSLLFLNFTPDEELYSPTKQMPSLAQRFVVALETLKWMNNNPFNKKMPKEIEYFEDGKPFALEVSEEVGIPFMWREVLKDSGNKNKYKEITEELDDWINGIHEALKTHYPWDQALLQTYKYWVVAKNLEKKLDSTDNPSALLVTKDVKRKIITPILNTIWSIRALPIGQIDPKRLSFVERITWKLLDPANDDYLIKEKEQPPPSFNPPTPQYSVNENIKIVLRFLSGEEKFSLRDFFEKFVDKNNVHPLPKPPFHKEILHIVGESTEVLRAYLFLYGESLPTEKGN